MIMRAYSQFVTFWTKSMIMKSMSLKFPKKRLLVAASFAGLAASFHGLAASFTRSIFLRDHVWYFATISYL